MDEYNGQKSGLDFNSFKTHLKLLQSVNDFTLFRNVFGMEGRRGPCQSERICLLLFSIILSNMLVPLLASCVGKYLSN